MPSLRELLGNMRYDKAISQSAYALFAALVEAVEPEDTGARYAGCKTLDERTIVKLAYELATAKAEIERLRHELSAAAGCTYEYRQKIMALEAAIRGYESQHGACGDCAADAEIGRMVRGMENDTGLTFMAGQYCARRCAFPPPRHWLRLYKIEGTDSADPAEALRAIQEVGDE